MFKRPVLLLRVTDTACSRQDTRLASDLAAQGRMRLFGDVPSTPREWFRGQCHARCERYVREFDGRKLLAFTNVQRGAMCSASDIVAVARDAHKHAIDAYVFSLDGSGVRGVDTRGEEDVTADALLRFAFGTHALKKHRTMLYAQFAEIHHTAHDGTVRVLYSAGRVLQPGRVVAYSTALEELVPLLCVP